MPIYTDKKTKRLFIKFDFRGHSYKQRLPEGTTKRDAESIEIKWKHQLLFEANGIEQTKQITFDYFLTEYFLPYAERNHSKPSFDYDLRVCKEALKFWRGKPLRQIKAADVDRFKSVRATTPTQHKRNRKPASVMRELSIISKIFSLAVVNEFLETNPCSKIEKPKFDNIQNNVLAWEDEEKFLDAFESEWARDVCILILNTGLRQNDALSLSRFSIDWREKEIRLLQGKTQRTVRIPMNQTVCDLLQKRWRQPSELLFPSPKTGNVGRSVKKAIETACRKSGIPRVVVRDLRRTYGTRLGEMNLEASATARLLGHGDLRSVHRYMRGQKNMRDAVENLASRANIVPLRADVHLRKAVND